MKRLLSLTILLCFMAMAGAVFAEGPKAEMPAQQVPAVEAPPAQTPPKIDTGDTAWMLVSTALVMLMTPGLALFYGGMVRRKNVLGTIMNSFVMLCLVSVIWVLWGYTLAFGPDKGVL